MSHLGKDINKIFGFKGREEDYPETRCIWCKKTKPLNDFNECADCAKKAGKLMGKRNIINK